jgi:fatty-acid desaturase
LRTSTWQAILSVAVDECVGGANTRRIDILRIHSMLAARQRMARKWLAPFVKHGLVFYIFESWDASCNSRSARMRIYNVIGYFMIMLYGLACVFFAPEKIGPLGAIAIGAVYLVLLWFLAGVYLADILHLGIAHRSLNFKPWFIKSVTIANNIFGIGVSPIEWVNRHRLHHKYADHDGDPNKLGEDGFWKTLYLCLVPYPCSENLAKDDILKSRVFLLCSSNWFLAASQIFNFALLWYIVGDVKFAAVLWSGLRIFALWVNMVQNYWTHTRIRLQALS